MVSQQSAEEQLFFINLTAATNLHKRLSFLIWLGHMEKTSGLQLFIYVSTYKKINTWRKNDKNGVTNNQ